MPHCVLFLVYTYISWAFNFKSKAHFTNFSARTLVAPVCMCGSVCAVRYEKNVNFVADQYNTVIHSLSQNATNKVEYFPSQVFHIAKTWTDTGLKLYFMMDMVETILKVFNPNKKRKWEFIYLFIFCPLWNVSIREIFEWYLLWRIIDASRHIFCLCFNHLFLIWLDHIWSFWNLFWNILENPLINCQVSRYGKYWTI